MTMHLTDDQERRLAEAARRLGQDPAEVFDRFFDQAFPASGSGDVDGFDREKVREAIERLQELGGRQTLGPGVSLRDLIDQGRS